MFRHLIVALPACLLAISAAGAADRAPQPYEPPAPVDLPFSWTGVYAGVNGGYGFGNDDASSLGESGVGHIGSFDTLDANGFFAGAQAGASYQIDSFVFGIEADLQKSWIEDGAGRTFVSALSPAGIEAIGGDVDIDWYGTLRARAGWAWDRTLFYGTGGLAFGSVDYSIAVDYDNDDSAHLRTDGTELGWVAGAGIEHAFTDNWTVKVEYQFIDLGQVTASGARVDDGGAPTGSTVSSSRDINFHSLKAGVNYKF